MNLEPLRSEVSRVAPTERHLVHPDEQGGLAQPAAARSLAPGKIEPGDHGRARPRPTWWRPQQIIRNLKKLLRTVQTCFPSLLDTKFQVMRLYRNTLSIPFENDFNALPLFPDTGDMLFLDVGANRGQSTDAVLMRSKRLRIHLFEPNRVLFENLQRMFGGNERIVLNNFGLADENSEGVLFVPFYKKWMFDGLGSFNKDEAANWLKGRMFFYKDRFLTLQESRIEIKRIDDLGLAPFFVKLDIQGYEYKALRGGEQTLRAYEPVLLIESPDNRTIEYLEGLGYNYYAFKGGKFVPRVIGAPNTFFMTPKKARLVRSYIV